MSMFLIFLYTCMLLPNSGVNAQHLPHRIYVSMYISDNIIVYKTVVYSYERYYDIAVHTETHNCYSTVKKKKQYHSMSLRWPW